MTTQKRIEVKKTYKLFINGAFPRSESGRVYEVLNAKDEFVANPCLASRKDLRDAVTAARAAQSGWAKATAYNRGVAGASPERAHWRNVRTAQDSVGGNPSPP